MDKPKKKLQINTYAANDSAQLSPEKKSFINKLYLDPIESLNRKLAETKSRGFRIKTDVTKTNTDFSTGMPTTPSLNTGMTMPPMTNPRLLNMNRTQGNVIMQNWETAKNIPSDIGEFIHFPVLVDRNKIKLGLEQEKSLSYTTSKNFKLSKNKIRRDGEKLIKSLYPKDNLALTMPSNYISSQKYAQQDKEEKKPKDLIDKNLLMTFQKKREKPKDLMIVTTEEEEESSLTETKPKAFQKVDINKMAMTVTTPTAPKMNIDKNKPLSKLIDFSTFNKHLFLKDNDFLYAKRVGGPVDYILCSYQDINK